MNEQIASWFEDLIPQIKETRDPRGTLLKFANEKNLAPALLERLGFIYNTAKTVNYLDKSAGVKRGFDFKILDVPSMLDEYTTKQATKKNHKYSNEGFKSLGKSSRIPKDLFMNVAGFDIELDKPEDYQEVKLKSTTKSAHVKTSLNQANQKKIEELKFNLQEDLRDQLEKFSNLFSKSASADFESIDQNALYYFEGTAKEACDLLDTYFTNKKGPNVKRASDPGKERLIKECKFLNLVGQIQDHLNNIKIASSGSFADGMMLELTDEETLAQKKNLEKQADVQVTDETRADILAEMAANPGKPLKDLLVGGGSINSGNYQSPNEAKGTATGGSVKADKSNVLGEVSKGVEDLVGSAKEPIIKTLKSLLPSGKKRQEEHDIAMEDVEHVAVLQNLLTSDEILSDADPERVIEAFNTVRKLAPELAADINIMRVQLRAMIQHDGMSIFDANQMSKAEMDKKKVDLQTRGIRDHLYKNDPNERPDLQLSR